MGEEPKIFEIDAKKEPLAGKLLEFGLLKNHLKKFQAIDPAGSYPVWIPDDKDTSKGQVVNHSGAEIRTAIAVIFAKSFDDARVPPLLEEALLKGIDKKATDTDSEINRKKSAYFVQCFVVAGGYAHCKKQAQEANKGSNGMPMPASSPTQSGTQQQPPANTEQPAPKKTTLNLEGLIPQADLATLLALNSSDSVQATNSAIPTKAKEQQKLGSKNKPVAVS